MFYATLILYVIYVYNTLKVPYNMYNGAYQAGLHSAGAAVLFTPSKKVFKVPCRKSGVLEEEPSSMHWTNIVEKESRWLTLNALLMTDGSNMIFDLDPFYINPCIPLQESSMYLTCYLNLLKFMKPRSQDF